MRATDSKMNSLTAAHLFESAIAWLRDHYSNFQFFTERDVVWTVQSRLLTFVDQGAAGPYKVRNDYPMMLGTRADLAILDAVGDVDVAVEFKYEPSHARKDILVTKFPVVSWGSDGVGRDVNRVQAYVGSAVARNAYAVFIDEGGHYRIRLPHPSSRWIDWGSVPRAGVSVLWTEGRAASADTTKS